MARTHGKKVWVRRCGYEDQGNTKVTRLQSWHKGVGTHGICGIVHELQRERERERENIARERGRQRENNDA